MAILTLLGSLVTFLVMWFKVGRDPKRGPIIPRYEPPEGFGPAELRYMKRRKFDDTCFSSTIINFAAKGILRIEKKRKYYHLKGEEKFPYKTSLTPLEEDILDDLMAGNREKLVLSKRSGSRIRSAQGTLKKSLIKLGKKYFSSNRKEFWGVSIVSIAALIIWLAAIGQLPLLLAVVMICIPVFFLTGWICIVSQWMRVTRAITYFI